MPGGGIKEEPSQRSGSVKSDGSETVKDGDKVLTEAEIYSKTLKIGKVEAFDWKYEEKVWDTKKGRF
jgi:hypothetical protein